MPLDLAQAKPEDVGFRAPGLVVSRVQGLRFKFQGSGFRVMEKKMETTRMGFKVQVSESPLHYLP